ncbi:hypothetical protein FNH22_17530 [Fulvivirga sp. M361]|uniref:hypothetical protein n=1 Tax=Fulvivirga sp. M361 TaxID=2594266 RepID=UPI001179A81F|nr:hypothetical protein [Fulvivirga sp. M361]TRX55965.1 hypothetical protein FNH22_17530 [Fulvivirga sp. M361]
MKRIILYLIVALFYFPAFGQLTGHVNYEKLGIAFDIPSGWYGEEGDGMLILRSTSIPGVIMIIPHNQTIEQLTQDARNGITEGDGTALKLSGALTTLSDRAVGGQFSGTMEWQPATAYIIGMSNPNEHAPGVYLAATTTKDQYNASYQRLCEQIYQSVRFSKTNLGTEVAEWKKWLSGVRLTYMNSYYSSDYTSGGISGGYSTEKTIDLCSKGHFNFNMNTDSSISGDGVSGYSYGNNDGQGTWEIGVSALGEVRLILHFHDGKEHNYTLDYSDDELKLNGTRYFRTTEGRYAPDCY